MNYIDIILLIPLVYGAFRGVSRGLVVEVATLLALLLGVFLSLRWSTLAEGFLRDIVAIPEAYSYYVAFAVIFLLVVILVHLLGRFITRLLSKIALGLVNHLLGLLFGVLKMAIFLGALLFLFNVIDLRYDLVSPETKNGSLLYNPLVSLADRVYHAVIH
jgi:membrane protein required for colicin V production